MLEYAISLMEAMRVTKKEHRERDEKFKEFTRDDLDFIFNPMSRPVMYCMIPFLVLRWTICGIAWVYMAIVIAVVGLFYKKGQPYDPVSYFIVKWSFKIVCRINLLMLGCWYLDYRKHFVDYSKYLGPDWKKEKATYGKSGIVCSNHFNWIDPIIHTWRQMPSAVVKADIENIPLIGPMGR